MTKNPPPSLKTGTELIKQRLKTLPDTPGVYRMLNKKGEALYIGKAKSLKRRVTSYTHTSKLPLRLQRMVSETCDMAFIHTHTEGEALLLESNLIKKLKPRYNILLRDDKSFPHIMITADHDFPLLTKHRGARKRKADYFGPFASTGAVNRTITILQKIFLLRNCTDHVFAQRKRPCLQYQIKRCTAPCVEKVTKKEYAAQVADAKAFLSGKSQNIQENFAGAMQKASDDRDYETAARYRDRIRALTTIQAHQDINLDGLGNADVIGLHREKGHSSTLACVQVFFFRGGQNFGNRAYFPRHSDDDTDETILSAFIAQFYENKPPPPNILVSHPLHDKQLLEESFKIKIKHPQRGTRKRIVGFVVKNAADALKQAIDQKTKETLLLEGVATLFGLKTPPERIEVYDNSHISGTNMVGAMIVTGPDGFRKSAYRKFNIKHALAADDYGMMREVIQRRFAGKSSAKNDWPDILLIDGGQSQFNAVYETLVALGIENDLCLVSIAKGPDRNAGREKFFVAGKAPFQLPENDPLLHYLQRLRDESHRFAIGAHRTRRAKQITKSPLDDVPGIGAKRKKALLHHFGSAQEVARAGLQDLEKVEGISAAIAQKIYDFFHEK